MKGKVKMKHIKNRFKKTSEKTIVQNSNSNLYCVIGYWNGGKVGYEMMPIIAWNLKTEYYPSGEIAGTTSEPIIAEMYKVKNYFIFDKITEYFIHNETGDSGNGLNEMIEAISEDMMLEDDSIIDNIRAVIDSHFDDKNEKYIVIGDDFIGITKQCYFDEITGEYRTGYDVMTASRRKKVLSGKKHNDCIVCFKKECFV